MIDSRLTSGHLDYARLLRQLWDFHWEDRQERIKIGWTQDFYRQKGKDL